MKLRVLAFLGVLGILAACGSGYALQNQNPNPNPNVTASQTATATASQTAKATASQTVAATSSPQTESAPMQPKKNPATASTPATKPANQPIMLYPVTAYYSQPTIDAGKLVTWMTNPTCLLAGHDNLGWGWLANVPVGKTVVVKTGPCVGTYVVFAHKWQPTKGGPIPDWMSGNVDLALQSCTGTTGMGFSLLHKTG